MTEHIGQVKARRYVPGVYRLSACSKPVIYFDGLKWWIPGWECPMQIGGYSGAFMLREERIGELLWKQDT